MIAFVSSKGVPNTKTVILFVKASENATDKSKSWKLQQSDPHIDPVLKAKEQSILDTDQPKAITIYLIVTIVSGYLI